MLGCSLPTVIALFSPFYLLYPATKTFDDRDDTAESPASDQAADTWPNAASVRFMGNGDVVVPQRAQQSKRHRSFPAEGASMTLILSPARPVEMDPFDHCAQIVRSLRIAYYCIVASYCRRSSSSNHFDLHRVGHRPKACSRRQPKASCQQKRKRPDIAESFSRSPVCCWPFEKTPSQTDARQARYGSLS